MSKSILLLFLTMPLFVSCNIRISEKPKTENTAVIEMDMNTYLVDLGIDDDYYPTELLIDSDMDGVLAAYDGKGTAFFVTSDGGKTWEKRGVIKDVMCKFIQKSEGVIYCHFFNINNLDEECVLSSKDNGKTWNTVLKSEHMIYRFNALKGGILVALVIDPETIDTIFEQEYYLITTVNHGKDWKDLRPYMVNNLKSTELCFIDNSVIYTSWAKENNVIKFNLITFQSDTIYRSKELMSGLLGGEDVIGIWEGHRANFYRVTKDSTIFMSSIWNPKARLRNYIPHEVYQFEDVVYTYIIELTYNGKHQNYISTDRAKTWSKINFDTTMDEEYATRSSAKTGYKDKIIFYCVGEKDGKRQDFIKVIKPKS